MKYDLSELYVEQAKLDNEINTKHNVTHTSTKHERILAFLVELGELCNETRCFKYWSLKGPSPKEVILEEYVDGLHFIMSLGLVLDYKKTSEVEVYEYSKESKLTDCLLKVYELATKLINDFSISNYEEVLAYFLGLNAKMGYSYDDLVDAYFNKLEINYVRQENNY